MQRKAIRATVGAADVDIPIHTFLDGQALVYEGGAVHTAVRVKVVGTPTTDHLASWFNPETIVDSGILLANIVTTTSTPTANQVPTFTGVGIKIQSTNVEIVGGAISHVTTLNGIDPATWVVGPSSATNNDLPAFDGTTGKLIKDTGIAYTTVVIGPASAAADDLCSYNSTTGKLIKDSGIATNTVVTITPPVTANTVPVFSGTGVGLLQRPVAIDGSGNMTGVGTINTRSADAFIVGPASAVNNNLAAYDGTTGKLAKDSGIATANVVTSAASPTGNQVAVWSGTGLGQLARSVTISSGGAVSGVATLNSIDPATWVVGPATATAGDIPYFSSSSGRLIADSGLNANYLVSNYYGTSVADNTVVFYDTTGTRLKDSGIRMSAHVSRHAPGGSDSMFATGAFGPSDVPSYYDLSQFYPKFIFASLIPAGSISGSLYSLTNSNPITLPRAGFYVGYWDFAVTTEGSAGTFTIRVTCANGSSFSVITDCSPNVGSALNSTSGADVTISVAAGTTAFTVHMKHGVYTAAANTDVDIAVKWSGVSGAITGYGPVSYIEGGSTP